MRFPLYRFDRPVITTVKCVINGRLFLLIGRVLQNGWKAGNQLINQFGHKPAEVTGLLWEQGENFGLARIIEVVYVAPDVWGLLTLGLAFQIVAHVGRATGSGVSHNEYVVTGAFHCNAELDRVDGSLLTQNPVKGLNIRSCFEVERIGVDRLCGKRVG